MTGHELEQNESVPDLVVERGGPPPALPPTGPRSQSQRAITALALALVFGPVAIAFIVRFVTTKGPWSPLTGLWVVAIGFLLLAGWFIDRGEKLKAAHVAAGSTRLRQMEAETLQSAIGIGIALIAEFVAVASFEPWLGVVLFGLLVAWILLCFLPAVRRIEGRSSVQVACTPDAAFALVSDPQKWRLWSPELETVEQSDTPVRLGTLVHSRMRLDGRILEGDERVVAHDPPRRCASEVLDVRGAGSDSYEMVATDGGTMVTYICRLLPPPEQTALSVPWQNRNFFRLRWQTKMQRIKRLLENEGAGSV